METLQLVIPILWTLILLGSVLYVVKNKTFPVTIYFDYVRVDASPSLTWSRRKKTGIILGFVFLVVMWIMFVLVAKDIILGGSVRSMAGVFLIFLPAVLSAIFFFSGYSAKLVNNYTTMSRTAFDAHVEYLGYGSGFPLLLQYFAYLSLQCLPVLLLVFPVS